MNKKRMINIILLSFAILIAAIPLVVVRESEFGGADGKAADYVEETNEGFAPWFEPVWTPPGGETESLLFAIQAVIGSGVIFYCIGYLKGRHDTMIINRVEK